MQEHCHTKLLATLYSLLAAVLPFATRHLLIRYSLPFPDLPICRFHDLPTTWLGRNFALPLSRLSSCASFFKSVSKKTKPAKAGWEKLEGASPDAPKIFGSAGALPSRKTAIG
jgi:hypothetical protein